MDPCASHTAFIFNNEKKTKGTLDRKAMTAGAAKSVTMLGRRGRINLR